MIKMIATDIDGTIFNWDVGEFTPAVKKCIKDLKASGVKVVLVTGRMYKSAVFLAKELEIETPIASYQGGLIVENGKTLYAKYLDNEVTKKIIDWGRKKDVHLNLYMDDVLYVEKNDEIIKKYTDARYIEFDVCNFDDLKIDKVNKILAIDYHHPEKVTEWVDYLKKEFPELHIVKSTPFFCEISHQDAKKSSAVEFLCNKWGIKKEEVLTIGDQDNDIELLQSGGTSVAMGNGSEAAKLCADYITDTVDNDGFVKAINKYVKII